MVLLACESGYVNAELIESYGVHEDVHEWTIYAYTSSDGALYILGRSTSAESARERLNFLVAQIVETKRGVIDITNNG